MAITVGTTAPIVPYVSQGGATLSSAIAMPLANSEVIVPGDCIVYSSGKIVDGNTDPTQDTIIGFAADKITAPASAGDADIVLVNLATPGAIFIGSFVGGATTDQVGVLTDYASTFGADFDLVELTVEAICAIDAADTAGDILVLAPAREQLRGKSYSSSTTTGTINPRVYFMVERSVFTNVLA